MTFRLLIACPSGVPIVSSPLHTAIALVQALRIGDPGLRHVTFLTIRPIAPNVGVKNPSAYE
jgi:hypothetical protein